MTEEQKELQRKIVNTKHRQYYADHREQMCEQARKWRQEHPEEWKAINRRCYEKHRETRNAYIREYMRKRRKAEREAQNEERA